ncbi:thiamine phosphate synthase [Acinetobacter sp. MD2(2019)]|uniref:thiamine phosphate synthase n=1 Tax=Acinetobacter sp. MD2(2019) TaxID=2605273 RepID=UPI002D1F2A26|nr:thiamine phosphate synthase [Acinetobacter sp. MD2(2019)]MEB3753395.1 thiamine phosphate synthase [Acinetobacter sp. MD2(2019)]
MRGLYLITNDDNLPQLMQKLEAALATKKVAILQYRRKKVDKVDQPFEVEKIKKLCEQYQTPFIINDDIKLAQQFGLGVHLGQDDGSILDALQALPQGVIIGRTCLNSVDLARQAIKEGATYVAFGAAYATSTKPEAGRLSPETLQQARQEFKVPLCVIGGLSVENAKVILEQGADLCAVISDILALNVQDIPARIAAWDGLFQETASVS